jgi:hypothetical protein
MYEEGSDPAKVTCLLAYKTQPGWKQVAILNKPNASLMTTAKFYADFNID